MAVFKPVLELPVVTIAGRGPEHSNLEPASELGN